MRPKDPFEDMLHRHRGLLFSLCRHYVRRGLEIDDLLQEATVALWRDHERLLSLSGIPQAALIWKIGRNAVIDCLRRVKETEELPENYEAVEEDRSLLRELHERIALLNEPDRSIVRLQLEGYDYKEIGEQVGMTEKNVSVRLVRIKEKLRKSMVI
ncbi:MAG: sigma-70 family RNA polymerase sigma factor [Bacteroidales bacterium]|nr:sigma-70 family RNA polymerase sigma factor [Bacteroidales bacterium]